MSKDPWDHGDEELHVTTFLELVREAVKRYPEARQRVEQALRKLEEEEAQEERAEKARRLGEGNGRSK